MGEGLTIIFPLYWYLRWGLLFGFVLRRVSAS